MYVGGWIGRPKYVGTYERMFVFMADLPESRAPQTKILGTPLEGGPSSSNAQCNDVRRFVIDWRHSEWTNTWPRVNTPTIAVCLCLSICLSSPVPDLHDRRRRHGAEPKWRTCRLLMEKNGTVKSSRSRCITPLYTDSQLFSFQPHPVTVS